MEEERKRLQLELKQIQEAYDVVKGQNKNNLHQLAAINKKIEVQEQYINNIGKEVRLIDDDIYYSAIEIARLKKQMDTLKEQYTKTVVYAYKHRSNYDYLNFIFSANSFNDAMKRAAYLKSYRNYREKQMQHIVKTRNLINKRYNQQLTNRKKKQQALDTRSGEFEVLETQKDEKNLMAKQLSSQAGSFQQQIAKKKEQDRRIKNNIAAVVRREIAEAKKTAREEARKQMAQQTQARNNEWLAQTERALGNTKTQQAPVAAAPPPQTPEKTSERPARQSALNPVGANTEKGFREVPKSNYEITAGQKQINVQRKTPSPQQQVNTKDIREEAPPAGGYLNYQADDIARNSNFSQNRGRLPHPAEGTITLGFGRYKIEGVGPEVVGDNPGVTYTTSIGAPVKAVFNGQVASVSRVGGTSFVVLRHGKYFTAYSNLATVNISKGASVSQGQTIGTVAADEETGIGKLDFILMIEEKNVDPRAWLR